MSNEGSGDVSMIDPATGVVTGSVRVGKRPRGLALSPDGSLLYVTVSGSPIGGPGIEASALPQPDKAADGIAVVDLGSRTLVKMLRGVSDPEQVAVSPDGELLYVASEDTGQLLVLSASSGRLLGAVAVGGEPEGVTVSRRGDLVLVTSEEDNMLALVAAGAKPRLLARIGVGIRPRRAAFSDDETRIFVPGEADASLSLIDSRNRSAAKVMHFPDAGAKPMDIAVGRGGRELYVTTGRGGTLARIDAHTLRYLGQVAVGGRPWGLALSPDGRFAFTANGPADDVAMVEIAGMRVVKKIAVGKRPWGVIASLAHK